jgi:hypothetical protein
MELPMRRTQFLVVAASLVLAIAVAAQSPPKSAPKPPPKGKTTPPATTFAPPSPIFRIDDVSRALTIRERQAEQLNTMTQRLQAEYQSQYERIGQLPDRDRQARLMELDRQYTAAWLKGATGVLDEKQLTRYQQLQIQHGGFATFNDPAIQRRLSLTDAQLKDLGDAMLWSNEQTQSILRQAQTDRTRAREAHTEFLRQRQERLNRILSAEQRRSWTEMTGEQFPFPPAFPSTTGDTPPKR